MPKLTPLEEIKELKEKLKVAEGLAAERGKIIGELNYRVVELEEVGEYNQALFTEQHTDFRKLALAYDQVRQVMVRTTAALSIDNINPHTIVSHTSHVYNEVRKAHEANK